MKVIFIFFILFSIIKLSTLVIFANYSLDPRIDASYEIYISIYRGPILNSILVLILVRALYSLVRSWYIGNKLATELTYGIVKSIQYSTVRTNNKPLVNIEVDYLGLTGSFKDQPGDFGFEFKKGDEIPVKYQKNKPEVAIIPSDAIEIAKKEFYERSN
jgi:hypothetical protein